jgi:hypothetical protein
MIRLTYILEETGLNSGQRPAVLIEAFSNFPHPSKAYDRIIIIIIIIVMRHRLDALLLTQVCFGLKFCPSVLEIVGLRVPARYIKRLCIV